MPTLYIKNMVCDRCRTAVRHLLQQAGLPPTDVQLGEVRLAETPTAEQLDGLREKLHGLGFELLDDKRRQTIERIKTTILGLVRQPDDAVRRLNTSEYLARQLGRDYGSLSSLFSEVEGITIERHVIHQKIEYVKEMLLYGELTLSEIADRLQYSSVAHLSNQFKKVTGLTPSHFKQLKEKKRKPLDKV